MRKRKTFLGCDHRGFGTYCHRCEQAAQCETAAVSGGTFKIEGRVMSPQEASDEAARLRANGGRS